MTVPGDRPPASAEKVVDSHTCAEISAIDTASLERHEERYGAREMRTQPVEQEGTLTEGLTNKLDAPLF
jgi:hypothetical protein